MQTIEQKCEEILFEKHTAKGREIFDAKYGAYPPTSWFKAGVDFAQRWISVKEELPDFGETVLVKTYDNKIFLYNSSTKDIDFFNDVIVWRPIEVK
jgi:hypothetical protein